MTLSDSKLCRDPNQTSPRAPQQTPAELTLPAGRYSGGALLAAAILVVRNSSVENYTDAVFMPHLNDFNFFQHYDRMLSVYYYYYYYL